jgi:hypothetical protein
MPDRSASGGVGVHQEFNNNNNKPEAESYRRPWWKFCVGSETEANSSHDEEGESLPPAVPLTKKFLIWLRDTRLMEHSSPI